MSFAGLHKLVAYLAAGLGLAALSLGPDLELPSQILIGLAYVASFFAEGPRIRTPGWVRGWNVAMVALLAVQVVRGVLGAAVLPLALEMTAGLQVSRLMNRRGAREHQHIGALALLQLIAATVLSNEIEYAFVFLGFVIVLPWMLAVSHLRAEIEGQLSGRPEPERAGVLDRVLASPRIVGPWFLAAMTGLAVPLFAMTVLLFLAFPRVGLGVLSFDRDAGHRVSGFGANVELGDFGLIRTDSTVVLRVVPPELPNPPPPQVALRMRGTSFDAYDGRRWTRSRDIASQGVGHVGGHYAIPRRQPLPGRDRAWQVVLDPLDEPVLFLPPNTVGIEVPMRVSGGMEVGRQLEHTPGVDIRYADADGLGLRYTAWTSDDPRDRSTEPLSADDLRRYVQVPAGHEQVAALARAWTDGAESDVERVRMLTERLRDSGEYTYSLEMPRVGDRVPLDVFLREAKRGHCEYFATALAIQLRTLGIPARNVTGFLGGTFNPYGGYYALAQGDAHSWVEVWLPEHGWTVVDPTPPSRDAIGPAEGLFRSLREMMDAVRTRWTEDVVGYDLRRQVRFFEAVRSWLDEGGGQAAPEERAQASVASGATPRWVWALVAALIGLGGLGLVLYRRRRGSATVEEPVHAREAVRLYRALDAALAKLGHARPRERTPLEHVAHLEQQGFAGLAVVREVTQRYLDARFGSVPIEASDVRRLESAIAGLKKPA
jgi:transglutaminase-like putative cysteine protease